MARTNDPHSATAQFFVNTVDNKFLDHTGKNARRLGLRGLRQGGRGHGGGDAIAAVQHRRIGRMGDVPVDPVSDRQGVPQARTEAAAEDAPAENN